MPDELLPLFPLQLVLFPGEQLKLHIFEPRYKQLIAECIATGDSFGIPTYFDKRVTEFGTEAVVREVYATYESGEMDIRVEGRRVFHLEQFVKQAPGKLYSAGVVTWLENIPAPGTGMEDEIWALFHKLHALLHTGHERREEPAESLSFALAHELGMSLGSKLELLGTPDEASRQRIILAHLRETTGILEALGEMKKRIQGNGQFHRFPEVDF
jgi:ATP-dependent Lon protease